MTLLLPDTLQVMVTSSASTGLSPATATIIASSISVVAIIVTNWLSGLREKKHLHLRLDREEGERFRIRKEAAYVHLLDAEEKLSTHMSKHQTNEAVKQGQLKAMPLSPDDAATTRRLMFEGFGVFAQSVQRFRMIAPLKVISSVQAHYVTLLAVAEGQDYRRDIARVQATKSALLQAMREDLGIAEGDEQAQLDKLAATWGADGQL